MNEQTGSMNRTYSSLQIENYELKQQNEALLAQVEELKQHLLASYLMDSETANKVLDSALKDTQKQFVSSIKSSVEEEAIERCAVLSWMTGMDEQGGNVMRKTYPRDVGSLIARELRKMQRKYPPTE